MNNHRRLLAACWFAVAGLVAGGVVWLATGMHSSGSAQQQNLVSYAASGIVAALFWGWVLGNHIVDDKHGCSRVKAASVGLSVAGLSLFSFGAVAALWLAVLDVAQGQLAQAGERILIAIPMGITLGFWGLLLTGWCVLPVGAIAGVLLQRYRGKGKSGDLK